MKKLVAVVLVLCMVFAVLPALAEEAKLSEEVLLKVKAKIDVPEDLTEFDYSVNKYDEVLRYDFDWRTEDYDKELYVSSDSLGRIISYNYYESIDYSEGRSLIGYTLTDAQPLAQSFIERVYSEYIAGDDVLKLNESLTRNSYSGRYKTFSFTYDRYYKNEPVSSNKVVIRIRATKDKIYVQSASAALDEDAKFVQAVEKTIGEEEYLENFPIETYYAKDYSDGDKVKLYYSIDRGFVSRHTGRAVTEEYFDRYAGYGDDAMADMESTTANGSASKNEVALTPQEIEELDKMTNLIAPEEMEKRIRSFEFLEIKDDMTAEVIGKYKQDEKYFVTLKISNADRETTVKYNGETGEIITIYTFYENYSEEDKAPIDNSVDIREVVKNFAAEVAGDKFNDTEISFEERGLYNDVYMKAVRTVNGIRYGANRIEVIYDARTGNFQNYYLKWDDEDTVFPDPNDAIGLAEGTKVMFDIAPIYNAYVKTTGGYVPAITISKNVVIDALTGKENNAVSEEKLAYTDIDGHWAEEMINVLWEHDIYLAGDKFKPEEAINQADMITLFSACRDGGIIPIGWEKDYIAEYGVESGYIEVAEPDKLMTREEAFRAMVNILGYGEVAGFDIYKSSYTDMEPDGSAEILKAMGILVGDTARPEDYLTHAEAAVMVYRYLSK